LDEWADRFVNYKLKPTNLDGDGLWHYGPFGSPAKPTNDASTVRYLSDSRFGISQQYTEFVNAHYE
jgi:hypothetical protein